MRTSKATPLNRRFGTSKRLGTPLNRRFDTSSDGAALTAYDGVSLLVAADWSYIMSDYAKYILRK